MTTSVSRLPVHVDHYPSCDREHYGRAVMALLDLDCEITAPRVRGWVWRFRETAVCGCLGLRIKAAQVAAVTASKRFEACLSDANAAAVQSARAELARLRGMA